MEFTINPSLIVLIIAVIVSALIVLIINGKKFIKSTASSTEDKREKLKRIIATLFFVIGGLPISIYPFVILANLMSIAGVWPTHSIFSMVFMGLFLFLTTVYPITYILCILQYKKGDKNLLLPIIPLLHILIIIGIGFLGGL